MDFADWTYWTGLDLRDWTGLTGLDWTYWTGLDSLDWTHWTGLTGLDSLDWTHWTGLTGLDSLDWTHWTGLTGLDWTWNRHNSEDIDQWYVPSPHFHSQHTNTLYGSSTWEIGKGTRAWQAQSGDHHSQKRLDSTERKGGGVCLVWSIGHMSKSSFHKTH
ncbi:hypothetical protein MMC34_005825 [Xylographa carneopallida]|nr:hypothetical protein [Xylographa carneopallida]